jgi:hypothetical protein
MRFFDRAPREYSDVRRPDPAERSYLFVCAALHLFRQHPSFHAIHNSHRERYFATPRTHPMGVGLNLAGRRKDDTEFPVEISLNPLLLGIARGIVAKSSILCGASETLGIATAAAYK